MGSLLPAGGDEHRSLSISQLERLTDPHKYIDMENRSKHHSSGFSQLWVENKMVTIVAVTEVGDCYPLFIFDTYFSKGPVEAIHKDTLHIKPLEAISQGGAWFTAVPMERLPCPTL